MSQCWATHAISGIRCDRNGDHAGKKHRFQWADEASTGFTAAPVYAPPVAGAVPPVPYSVPTLVPPVGVPDAEGVDNPTGVPAISEEDVARATRPLKRIVTPCVVCGHNHPAGTACNGKTQEGMDCGCLAAIPSNS